MGISKEVIYDTQKGMYFNFCAKNWIKEVTIGCLIKSNYNIKELLSMDGVVTKKIVVDVTRINDVIIDEVLITM